MAKKTKADLEAAGQMELIDVDDPKLKDIKREITGYDKMLTANKEQHAADRKAEKAKRAKVLEAIVAAGVKPDADGTYHLCFGGKQWDISQEAQLKIKKHNVKDGDPDDDDGADDDEAPDPE